MIPTILKGFDYLVNVRKLTESTIRQFNLGYCDSQGETYIGAEFTGTLPTLPATMRNSTLFPIMDLYNNCVAVSARPLGSAQTKYVNTVYDKADHLYGLSVTWQDCLKEQKVYVVEGNLSMLTPWQHGLKNIVAMLGSNFSMTQLCLLSRFVKNITFIPDGDKAGINFVEKLRKNIPSKFYDSDIQFSYIQLPNGNDPDDYFKQHTLEEFKALPENKLVL